MLRNRILLALAAATLAAATVVSFAPTASSDPGPATADSVSGRVYDDVLVDGDYDAATDTGVAGLTVDAYGPDGTKVGTATTTADGTYTITLSPVPPGDVRIEFETPSGFQATFARPEVAANRSSIRFVAVGATDVDYGVFDPTTYCTYSLASVCIHQGASSFESSQRVVGISPFSPPTVLQSGRPVADHQDSTYVTTVGEKGDVGATWGLGYQQKWGLLWNSAVIRRYAGLGHEGIGGVYVFERDGTFPLVSFDLEDYGLTLTDGTLWTDASRDIRTDLLSHDGYSTRSFLFQARDVQGYAGVGKMGVGDVDVSIDGNYLWVANLYERKIQRLAIGGSAGSPTLGSLQGWSLADGVTCAGSTGPFRAWAMDPQSDGTLIVAGLCTNENATPAKATGPGAGVILRLNPANSGPAAWTTLTSFAFDYPHVYEDCEDPLCTWKSWTDDWSQVKTLGSITGSSGKKYWTQPLIVNVEQLPDGSFALGVSDRFSYQMGQSNYEPVGDPAATAGYYTGWVAGDTLLVCKTAGGWERESGTTGAACGTNYSSTRSDPWSSNPTTEFFYDNYGGSHAESTIGGLAYANGQLAVASMDPADYYLGGVRWISTTTGDQTNALDLTPKRVNSSDSGFGKSAGMGDLEAICDGSPLQIGNRIWYDLDHNGIQDPDELPVVGVTVRLYDSGDNLVGTAVTDANGEYYFTSSTVEPADGGGTPDAFGGGLAPDDTYTIRLNNTDDCDTGGPLFGWLLTTQNASSATSANDDLIDSDASGVGSSFCGEGTPTVAVSTRAQGTVDHSFDIGFYIDQVSVGDYVWGDVNRDGLQDATDVPLVGVTLTIHTCADGDVTDVFGNALTTTTTDLTGHYTFDHLPPGCYKVAVTTPDGFEATLDEVGSDRAIDSSTGEASSRTMTTDGDRDATLDFGFVAISVSVGDYVWFDANGDGLQDATDVPLSGVVLTIHTCADGAVTDGYGVPLTTTATNGAGWYTFVDLPPGCYKVSVTDPDGYVPTLANAGPVGTDSSTGFAISRTMTTDGDRDPTLDFGYVRADGGGPGDGPGGDGPGGLLAFTGAGVLGPAGGALVAILIGALLISRRRRPGRS